MHNLLLEYALTLKFQKATIIDFKEIQFNNTFRKYCKQNLCKNYNANYSCPPYCGSFNAVYKKISKYNNALVLYSVYNLNNSNKNEISICKKEHNYQTLLIKKYLQDNGIKCVIAGAGNCDLCDKCNALNQLPCNNVENRYSSTSAYCIDVYKLSLVANFEIIYTKNSVSLISIVFF